MTLAWSVFLLLVSMMVISVRTQDFSSIAVQEGPCFFPPPPATSLIGTNLVNLLNVRLADWYAAVASKHFVRTMYEFFNGQAATSQAQLDAWNLVLQYLGPFELWNLYGETATDVCLLVPDLSNPLGIPIFHCALQMRNSNGLLGLLGSIFSPIDISDYTIIWDDNQSNLLLYRCHYGQKDWVLFTSNISAVTQNTLDEHVYPFLQQYNFSTANVQFLNYTA